MAVKGDRVRLAVVAILCLAASPSPAEPPSSAPASTVEPTRPRVALALSGGGARGIAHVGALRALEEAGIPVDAIAANSMGAVVGGIYATGRTSAELEQIVRSMDWASLFSGKPDRQTVPVANRNDRYASVVGLNFDWKKMRLPAALLAEHRINRFLIENLSAGGYAAAGEFDRLPIPFHPIAGDLATGDPVVLTKGDLALAVRASMSIPVVFPPVDWEGKKLVDGLIVNNLPIDVAKAFGAEVLVAVDIGSPPLGPERYESALGVAAKVTDLLARRRYLDFAAAADVLVRPDLGDHSASDYSGFDELIEQGYEATKASLPAIRAKLLEAGIAVLAPRPKEGSGPVLEGTRIAAVRILGNERVSEGLARRTFNIPVGRGYSMERGVRAFDKIAASELFDRTWLAFAPVLEGVDVLLRVKEAPPNRAEVGLGYTEWEKARGSIRLRNQNTLGFGEQVELLLGASDAERIVEASLRGERLFVTGFGYRVAGYADRDKPRFFDAEGDEINRALFDRDGVDLALRTSRKRWGLIEGGVRFGRVKTHPEGGLENLLPEADDRQGAVFGSAVIDTLDDLAWPEHGQRFALFGDWSLADLGADLEYWRARAEYRGSRRLGERFVAELDGVAGFSGKPVPVYDWYRLGGVALVPGYHHEELKGPQELAAALSLRYRLFGQLRVVARGGAGNVFASTDDITLNGLRWGVGLGVYHPSPIGPVSIEVDVRDGGSVLAALSVGWN